MSLAFALMLQASLPAITIVPGTGNELVAQIEPFEERRIDEVEAAAERTMAAACKGRPIGWGNISSKGTPGNSSRPSMVTDYRRTFWCLDFDPTRYPHAPAGWKATDADYSAASKTFATFFQARDSGELDRAFAMIEPNSHGNRAQWMTSQQDIRQALGRGGERSITKIGWYLDPPETPFPGIYAQLSFTAEFPGMAVYCGTMVLYRSAPDKLLLVGALEHILPVRENPTAERIAEFRKQFCE